MSATIGLIYTVLDISAASDGYLCHFKEGGPGSWKTSNGRASDYLLIIITSLRPCCWLFRECLSELIDHNKMNDMGQLRSPTQTRL